MRRRPRRRSFVRRFRLVRQWFDDDDDDAEDWTAAGGGDLKEQNK